MLSELLAVMRKELRQAFRDRRMAAMLLMAPVLQLTLLGYAVDLDVDEIATVVVDRDRSPASRELLRGLLADATFRYAGDVDDPVAAVQDGRASVALVVPARFGRDLTHGRTVEVQVLVDGTDPIRAQVATSAAAQFLQQRSLALSLERLRRRATASAMLAAAAGDRGSGSAARIAAGGRAEEGGAVQPASAAAVRRYSRISVKPRLYYNPRMKSPVYMVPGVLAMVLLVITTVVTAMSIARERELGTIEQLLVTPMRPAVLLLGKVLPFALVGLVTSGLVLAVGTHLFAVPVRGPLSVVFVGVLLYLLSTLGTGVFISTIARTQQQAILGSFFFMLPAVLLSGFMSPIENIPGWLQPLTYINPVRYFLEILRSCLLKGAGFADLAFQLVALGSFGALILALASIRFRKRLA